MTLEELERFEGIKERMRRRACQCGHCEDLRWLLLMMEKGEGKCLTAATSGAPTVTGSTA